MELARQALQKGWQVSGTVRTDVDRRRMKKTMPEVTILKFDVRDNPTIDKIAAGYEQPIDVLINNAGVIGPERQSTTDMDFVGFGQTLAINTLAPLKISQVFLKNLLLGNNPRLVTISSNMGRMQHSQSNQLAYRASKSAVNKVVQGLATDLKDKNICVIAMHPGWVQSEMGGSNADISVGESAEGLLNVIGALTMNDTGQFIDWNGTRQKW